MSEKQFTIVGEEYVGYMQGNAYIISNGECKFSLWENKEDAQKVCDYLNELAEENEQLKETNEKLQWELDKTRDLNYFANSKVGAMRVSCRHDRCYVTSMQNKGD